MNNTKRKQKETELSGFAIIGNGMHESGHSRKIPYRRAFTFPTPTHLHSLRHATNSRAKWHKVISARLFFSSFFLSLYSVPYLSTRRHPPCTLQLVLELVLNHLSSMDATYPCPYPAPGESFLPPTPPSLVSQRDKDGKPPGREPSRQIPISEGLLFLGILFMLL